MSQKSQKEREAAVKVESPSVRALRPRKEGKVITPTREQARRNPATLSPQSSASGRSASPTPMPGTKVKATSTSAANLPSIKEDVNPDVPRANGSSMSRPAHPTTGNTSNGPWLQETFHGVPTRPVSERFPSTTTLSTRDWSAIMKEHGCIYTDRQGNWLRRLDSLGEEDMHARVLAREPSFDVGNYTGV